MNLPSEQANSKHAIDVSQWSVAGVTDVGNFRKNNEDFILTEWLSDETGRDLGLLAIVCDGVGGGACGEIASELSATSFRDSLMGRAKELGNSIKEHEICRILEACCQVAHETLLAAMREDPSKDGMASTFSAIWLFENRCSLVQIGDSRIYRQRGKEFIQISTDQSPVGELRQKGVITEEEARIHPYKNIVRQVLGGSSQPIEPDCDVLDAIPGDLYLLCSDGLTDSLEDSAILDVVENENPSQSDRIVNALLQKALNASGRDNVSLIVVLSKESENALFRFRRKLKNIFAH